MIKTLITSAALAAGILLPAAKAQSLDLSGEWIVDLPGNLNDGEISLPGTLDLAGYGTPADTSALSRDEQFRRLTRRYSYIGPATYTRDFHISKDMAGKPLKLSMERVLWKSSASIDGKPLENTEYSLVAPHSHILPDGLSVGKHTLEVVIDNSRQYDISVNNLAHAYTNDTQTIWNGMLGDISLSTIPECDIDGMEIYPAADLSALTVKARILNHSDKVRKQKMNLTIPSSGERIERKLKLHPGLNIVEETLPAEGLSRWNEFNPNLHEVRLSLGNGETLTTRFGLRTVDNKDGLRVNGTPIFLRGTLECCVFPLTGIPPTDKKGWEKTFATAREWGLNHLRFHSWCPPEAAFEVADSLGMYVHVELPVWSLKIGDDAEAEQFLRDEYKKIVENYGNHPSFITMSVGNELQHDFSWLNKMVADMKGRDLRHLYATTSFTFEKGHGGHPEPEDQFFITQWTDDGWVRGQSVFETDKPAFNKNYTSSLQRVDVPLISHEIGQYAVYPSMNEIAKYTGILNPLNFKNIRSDLQEKGLLDKSEAMTLASAKFAALLYKEEIERALKTPGMSGFQLLGLQDFPGQGTALVGLLDAFWDNKGAVSPEWFRQFNSPVVPLLNYNAAVYDSTAGFEGSVLVANYSDSDLEPQNVAWSMTADGHDKAFAEGVIHIPATPAGKITEAGGFRTSLTDVKEPSAVTVRLRLDNGEENSWKIFVYPQVLVSEGDVVCTRSVDEALAMLAAGKKVLLSPDSKDVEGLESKFLPVFWSPVHFPKQAGTMGIMNDPDHPALAGFPNDGHSDWQWWNPVKNAKVVNVDSIEWLQPIVSVIDNFVHNRKLAYIFEAKCGGGSLLFSSIDLLNDAVKSPEMDALKNSLLRYMNSDAFKPTSEVSGDALRMLVPCGVGEKSSSATDIYE